MMIFIEYRAKPSSQNANPRIDVIKGDVANPHDSITFATERATTDPELAWVDSILLRDDDGPIPHWLRDGDA